VPTEGVGSEIVPDNKDIFHVVLKYSTKTKNKTKQKKRREKQKNKNKNKQTKKNTRIVDSEIEINFSILCLLYSLLCNKATEMVQYYK